jgi:hypothetical protein
VNAKRFLIGMDIVLVCLLIFVGIVYFIFYSNKGSFVPLKTDNSETILIGPEYKSISDGLIDTVNKKDPRAAISQLKEDMRKNPKVLSSCHELLHVIGRASYDKYDSFTKAMVYRDDICVSGYVHGVIEAYSWQNKNNASKLMSVCNSDTTDNYNRWACIHGIGHGLMFASKSNVPYALQKCSEFKTYFDQDACYSGAYMQNFNFDPDDNLSKYVSFVDPFQACRLASNHQDECYINAPIFYLNYRLGDYTGVLKWCTNAPLAFQTDCYEGVGSQIAAHLFNTPQKVEALCNGDESNNPSACLRGMMSWYIDYYAALAPAAKICPMLKPLDQTICHQAIIGEKSMFN